MRIVATFIVLAVLGVLIAASLKTVGDDEVALTREGPAMRELKPGLNLLRPFAEVRRHKLRQEHVLAGRDALIVRLPGRSNASVEGTVVVELSRDRIADLDGRYGDRIFDRLIRPLLARELSGLISDHGKVSRDYLDTAAATARDGADEKARPLGISIISIHLEGVTEIRTVAHDLERTDGVKVFVLGLDGYDWLIVDKVLETRNLKNIRKVRKEGAWGNLRSIEPLISPLIWTTMVTGVTPDIHGITDFLVHDEDTGEETPVTSSMRRVPALWNITSLFDGLTCGFIGWFASFPAEEVEGFIVSDRFAYHMFDPAWKHGGKRVPGEGQVYPQSLYDELESLKVEPEDVRDDLGAYIAGRIGPLKTEFDPNDIDSNLRLIISAYRTYEKIMQHLYPDRKPDLFGVYFEFTDSMGHLLMKYMKPAMEGVSPEDEERYGQGIAATYLEADRIIGDVLDMIDESTVLIVVSDHGFKSGDMRPLSDSRMGFGQAVEWHRINGSIAIYGNIVKPGYELRDASVKDVAPTILYLLGLPVDRSMTGRVLSDAFDDSWVESHPVAYTTEYDSLVVRTERVGQASAADKALKDKLVSLGYIAGGSRAMVNLANFYHRNGRFAEALEIWKQLASEDPNDLGAKIGMSNANFELGKPDLAVAGLNEVLDTDPVNLKALGSLATIYIKQGKAREALQLAQRGLNVDDRDGESYFNKGTALQILGREEEAAEEFRRAIRFAPDLAEAYANLAQIYTTLGRSAAALELAQKGVELASDKAEMHYVLGLALEANGRGQEAKARFLAASEMNPRLVLAFIGVGRILMGEGKLDSVITVCTRAVEIPSPYAPLALNVRGSAHFTQGNMALAARDFSAALQANSAFLPARLNLAKVFIREGRRQDAVVELERILSAHPNHAEAKNLLEAMNR